VRKATKEGTKYYIEQHNLIPKPLGTTDLYVSELGFGSYRVNLTAIEHKDALIKSLKSGVNLIDTSPNYSDGDAERLIGNTLHELSESTKFGRENVVLVSKVGYVQGKTLTHALELKKNGRLYDDFVEIDQNLSHCIHPDFINEQLEDSLDRLQTSCIDVFLLHNPEYFKLLSKREKKSRKQTDKEYYERIKKAFMFLEEAVKDGRIQYYGISSNTFPVSKDDFMHTSLEKCITIANEISETNHFKVVQFPLNLIETGAVTDINQSNKQSTLDVAKNNCLGVLINRPFNALNKQSVFRLVELDIEENLSSLEVEDAIEEFKLIEVQLKEIVEEYLKSIDVSNDKIVFDLAQLVHSIWMSQPDVFYWKELLELFLIPRVEHQLSLFSFDNSHDRVQSMIERYLLTLNQTAKQINAYFTQQHTEQTDSIKRHINDNIDAWKDAFGLSHKSIRALRTTEGISSILVGMRKPEYVDDILKELNQKIRTNRIEDWQKMAEFQFVYD